MIAFEEAQRIILEHINLLGAEQVELTDALNRIVAEDQTATFSIPTTDNASMDGYAFGYGSSPDGCYTVCGYVPAGIVLDEAVPPGCAVRIMTGGTIPPGCDTVAPLEDVLQDGEQIHIQRELPAGAYIRRRGEDVRQGDVVISSGTLIRPQEIAMLAAMGMHRIAVYRRAKVAVLATGDELLPTGSDLLPGQQYDSNSHALAAQLREAGAEPVLLGIAGDDPAAVREKIMAGLDADMLLISGGVSVGDRDVVRQVITELGGRIHFWRVNIKPGKPLAFATLYGKPLFALPGNPVSTMVTFELFVRPALLKFMGHRRVLRSTIHALLEYSAKNSETRHQFAGCAVSERDGVYYASLTGSQSSGRLSVLTKGNGLAHLLPGTAYKQGESVEVILLDRSFELGALP